MTTEPLKPRVIEGEAAYRAAAHHAAGRDVGAHRPGGGDAAAAAGGAGAEGARRAACVSFGLAAIGVAVAGWFIVDAYWWIAAAFERSTALGTLAATAVVAGVAGAGAIIAREVTSLWRLRNVETIRAALRRRTSSARRRRADASPTSWRWCRASARRRPRSRVFQRQVQPHHNVAQQVEILSRTVMKPLDAPRRGARPRRGAARLRHHRDQPDRAERRAVLPRGRRAHGAPDRGDLRPPSDHRRDRASAAPAGGRGRQARRRRHRVDLDRPAARRRGRRAPRHHRRRRRSTPPTAWRGSA